jgi:hypothetical protein
MVVGGKRHALAALPPGKKPGTHVQEAEWVRETIWTGAENLTLIEIQSSDHPARSNSLYWLRYAGSLNGKILHLTLLF